MTQDETDTATPDPVPKSGAKRTLSTEKVAELRRVYVQDKPRMHALAQQFGVSSGTVRAVLAASPPYDVDGPSLRTPVSQYSGATKISTEEAQAIQAEYAAGVRVQTIAETRGYLPGTIYTIIRRRGRFARNAPKQAPSPETLLELAAGVDAMIVAGRTSLDITKYVLENAPEGVSTTEA